MSPNNAICIVWATSKFLFYFILLIFGYSKVGYSVYERLTWPWGLRDGDIGANGLLVIFFFPLLYFFYILNCLRSYCVCIGATIRFRERGVGANEPKRCNMRRLGCKWVFFFLILLIVVYSKVSKVLDSVYERLTRLWGLRDGDIGANGPKRRNMHRLGYQSVFFFFLYCNFLHTKLFT